MKFSQRFKKGHVILFIK